MSRPWWPGCRPACWRSWRPRRSSAAPPAPRGTSAWRCWRWPSRWPCTFDADATALAIATSGGDACYLDTALLTPDDDVALGRWLAAADQPKALHEAKLARHDLAGRGWRLDGVTSDTALAAYLVRPGQRSFALDDLSVRYLGRELRAEDPGQQQLSLLDDTDGADEQAAATLMLRARAVVDLADALDGELAKIDESNLLTEMELPVQTALAEMEAVGIAVDLDRLSGLQSRFADEIRDAAEAAYVVIGKQINLGSPKQLQLSLIHISEPTRPY